MGLHSCTDLRGRDPLGARPAAWGAAAAAQQRQRAPPALGARPHAHHHLRGVARPAAVPGALRRPQRRCVQHLQKEERPGVKGGHEASVIPAAAQPHWSAVLETSAEGAMTRCHAAVSTKPPPIAVLPVNYPRPVDDAFPLVAATQTRHPAGAARRSARRQPRRLRRRTSGRPSASRRRQQKAPSPPPSPPQAAGRRWTTELWTPTARPSRTPQPCSTPP